MASTGSIEDLIVAETAYHPRTSKHSDTQSLVIVRDLLSACPLLGKRAPTGEVVAKLRHHQQVGHNDWVIDIALGTPAGEPQRPNDGEIVRLTEPALIQIAIELKSIWTEHGKARKNRLRDFNAFHGYAHQYNPKTVAAAFLVINASELFLSPLNIGARNREPITWHRQKAKTTGQLVKETIDIFRSIALRNSESDADGLEALGVVVVEHDNLNYLQARPQYAKLLKKYGHLRKLTAVSKAPPALRVGDPLHYSTMIQRICNAYTERFG
ncbi:MAG TPA: hypothetical protein VK438_05680 [Xanthobacteraceae bacterium]|nr:hypothetical protein [Xanthobacteraceae bacterium]